MRSFAASSSIVAARRRSISTSRSACAMSARWAPSRSPSRIRRSDSTSSRSASVTGSDDELPSGGRVTARARNVAGSVGRARRSCEPLAARFVAAEKRAASLERAHG